MRRLVLHIDVNKTIVMSDNVQHLSMDQVLNKIIACEAWGQITEKEGQPIWRPAHDQISIHQPAPDLVTYDKFIKDLHMLKTAEEEESPEVRLEFN
jgi:hypothetical protein